MKKIVFLILFFSVSYFVNASVIDSIGITTVNNTNYIQYQVNAGETLYSIANKYKTSVAKLQEINPQLKDGLKLGQVILIPSLVQNFNSENVANENQKNDSTIIHIVQSGDTYYSISKKYNVPVNQLIEANGQDLKLGQELKIIFKPKVIQKSEPIKTEPVTKSVVQSKPSNEAPTQEVEGDSVLPAMDYNEGMPRVMVIPFNPHLYWSDCDMEIAKTSNLDMPKIRQAFRRRLNALLDPDGYEAIHLLGGRINDSLTDLNRIYTSVSYDYSDEMYTQAHPKPEPPKPETKTQVKNTANNIKNIFKKGEEEENDTQNSSRAVHAKNPAKYYAVRIKDPSSFFNYFNTKYRTSYYIFINQFEIETDYTQCSDRARQNYKRNLVTHFSIFDNQGKQVAGHRIITHYPSNSNNLTQILKDNMEVVAKEILAELPHK